jgi:hypothetical protein
MIVTDVVIVGTGPIGRRGQIPAAGRKIHLQYATTSPIMHKCLGVTANSPNRNPCAAAAVVTPREAAVAQ